MLALIIEHLTYAVKAEVDITTRKMLLLAFTSLCICTTKLQFLIMYVPVLKQDLEACIYLYVNKENCLLNSSVVMSWLQGSVQEYRKKICWI